jgi:heat shock protein HslJ
MYCNKKMEVENAFVKEIASYNTYEVKGHKLILTNDKNEQIECIAQDWD